MILFLCGLIAIEYDIVPAAAAVSDAWDASDMNKKNFRKSDWFLGLAVSI